MGHHINDKGQFQSNKYSTLDPDKIVIDFKDPESWPALEIFADSYYEKDSELCNDILARVEVLRSEHRARWLSKGYILVEHNGVEFISKMPSDGQWVDVMTGDGSVVRCEFYHDHDGIDFMPINDDGSPNEDNPSILNQAVAWKRISNK